MDERYLEIKTEEAIKDLKKMLYIAIMATFLLASIQVGMLLTIDKNIADARIDIVLLKLMIDMLIGIVLFMIWKSTHDYIEKEMTLFKFYIDCIIQHVKIRTREECNYGTSEFSSKKNKRVGLFVGKAKDFKEFGGK